MSVEELKGFFDVGTVVLLFLTFAFGAGAFFTGDIINKRQAEQLRQFEKSLTDAKINLGNQQERTAKAEERAALAEKSLLQLKESLKDRSISAEQKKELIKALTGQPNGPVEILWMTSDSDAYPFVLQIMEVFKSSGWTKVIERMAMGRDRVRTGHCRARF